MRSISGVKLNVTSSGRTDSISNHTPPGGADMCWRMVNAACE